MSNYLNEKPLRLNETLIICVLKALHQKWLRLNRRSLIERGIWLPCYKGNSALRSLRLLSSIQKRNGHEEHHRERNPRDYRRRGQAVPLLTYPTLAAGQPSLIEFSFSFGVDRGNLVLSLSRALGNEHYYLVHWHAKETTTKRTRRGGLMLYWESFYKHSCFKRFMQI